MFNYLDWLKTKCLDVVMLKLRSRRDDAAAVRSVLCFLRFAITSPRLKRECRSEQIGGITTAWRFQQTRAQFSWRLHEAA
jgi:hypothetical protein